MSFKLKQLATLSMVLIISLYCSSLSANSSSKIKKMKTIIKQQQDTIDLLKLKLKKCNGGYTESGYSYSIDSSKTRIANDAITYP